METHFTFKLEDLGNLEFPGTPLAVIGHPIKLSVSPAMHNAAFAMLRPSISRFNDWAYYRFDIAPDEFAGPFPFYKYNFLGLNLTILHSAAFDRSMAFLTESAWALSLLFGESTVTTVLILTATVSKKRLKPISTSNSRFCLLARCRTRRSRKWTLDGCQKLISATASRLSNSWPSCMRCPAAIVPLCTGQATLRFVEQGVLVNATLGLKEANRAI